MLETPYQDHLARWERAALILLALVALGFGVVTVHRSAFLATRRTDADVYFRAAWAVRAGENPYLVKDTNSWHYHYPPLLAILLAPLADSPGPEAEARADGWVSYPVATALWYLVGLALLVLALHQAARGLESAWDVPRLHSPPPFNRPWWRLRVFPLLACVVPIGFTLVRGQLNTALMLAAAAFAADWLGNRHFRAGLWLGLGACVKPYLGAVLLAAAWRRRWGVLGGFAAGLVLGIAVIPALLVGPARTLELTRDFYELRLKGLVTGGMPAEIQNELDVVPGNFPSYGVSLFKALHPDPATRPARMPEAFRWFSVVLAAALGLITLQAWGFREGGGGSPAREILALGAFLAVMIPALPTCKPHYYALATLLVTGLLADDWGRRDAPSTGWPLTFLLWSAALMTGLEQLPVLRPLRDFGALPLTLLVLWAVALQRLRARPHDVPTVRQTAGSSRFSKAAPG